MLRSYWKHYVNDTCGFFEAEVNGLAVDDVGGFVYWLDGFKTIKQTSIDGSNTKTILESGKLTVTCKLINWIMVIEHSW